MLDPFRKENPDDVAKLKTWQGQIHNSFVEHVKTARGNRLTDHDDLFTGEVWVGKSSIDVGLTDGIGHVVPKMKEIFGDKVRFNTYGTKRSLFQRLGANVAGDALELIEERSLFARFGI